MKKKRNSIIAIICCFGVLFSGFNVFAADNLSCKSGVDASKVTDKNFSLTEDEKETYDEYKEGLVDCIRTELLNNDNASTSDIEKTLIEYNSKESTNNPVLEKIEDLTGISNDLDLLKNEEHLISEDIINECTETFSINNAVDVTITPTTVYLDELDVQYDKQLIEGADSDLQSFSVNSDPESSIKPAYAPKEWTKVRAAARRTLFTSIGKTAASVHTGGKFKFNGSKAMYFSDFYGYYKLYYTSYRALSFDKRKESAGNSYQFYAYGTFCKYINNNISGKTKKISCKIKCSPSGKITKSYTPKLK